MANRKIEEIGSGNAENLAARLAGVNDEEKPTRRPHNDAVLKGRIELANSIPRKIED